MEVVLLLVGIAGVALVVLPRLQRRANGSPRPARGRSRRTRRGRRTRVAPATISSAPAAVDIGGWDDDLGWENVESAPPAAREAWDEWRVTESPLARGPEAVAEPAEPEPPSVERWRTKTQDADWVEDDDGLGWEGRHEEPTPPRFVKDDDHAGNGNAEPGDRGSRAPETHPVNGHAAPVLPAALVNTNGHAAPGHFPGGTSAPEQDAPVPGLDHSPAPDHSLAPDWTHRDEPAALAAADVALSDEDWDDQPTGREWGAAPATAAPAPAAKRRPRIHPVLALGVYAVVGIGLVVLAATALLGGSGDPAPRAKTTTPKPVATPALTGSVVDDAAEEATAAKAAAVRKARGAYRRERAKAIRARAAAVANARAAARREARAVARARARARDRAASRRAASPAPVATPAPAQPSSTVTPQTNPAPAARQNSSPAPRPAPACEFCIG